MTQRGALSRAKQAAAAWLPFHRLRDGRAPTAQLQALMPEHCRSTSTAIHGSRALTIVVAVVGRVAICGRPVSMIRARDVTFGRSGLLKARGCSDEMNTTNTDPLDFVSHIEGRRHARRLCWTNLSFAQYPTSRARHPWVFRLVCHRSPCQQHAPAASTSSTYLPTTAQRGSAVLTPPLQPRHGSCICVFVVEPRSESGCHRFVLV
jgi:hypothetical protein